MSDDPLLPDSGAGPIVQLDLREPHRHLVRVAMHLTPRTPELELRLPAWTPGSYLIRDHVRHLEGLEVVQDGLLLPTRRRAEACWHLTLASLAPLVVRYRLQATELSVRTCHLNADHGFLALAGVVLQVSGERWHPHRLELGLSEGWQAFVPLPGAEAGGWMARDFDQLIDSPVEVGPHACHRFSVAGVPHRWVSWGDDLPGRDPGWLDDVEQVALACCRLMGEPSPASGGYLFVLHLLEEGYGGLEHDDASVLQFSRRALAAAGGRRKLLQLLAHEYLHQWNGRRLRPAALTPIDYDRAMIAAGLWFVEGVTSYLDLLLPQAAGVDPDDGWLEDLGAELSCYLLTPGRRIQGLVQSAEEAWVKLYRQDASSPDSQISYYLKGAVLALVLDLHLRRRGSCLALVLRALWRSHGAWGRGYSDDDLLAAFVAQAEDLAELLPHWLVSGEDPDLAGYLADVGLALEPELATEPFLGWQLEGGGARPLTLRRVHRDGPAQRGCLQAGDELLALDGQRLRVPEDLRLAFAAGPGPVPPGGRAIGQPDEPVAAQRELLYCRDGRVRSTRLLPDPPQVARWRLVLDPSLESAQCSLQRRRWLGLVP